MDSNCPRCGAAIKPEDRFCSACGTQLEPSVAGERKIATMVFVDLVGSTELGAGLDPEELRARLEPFFEVARASLEDHGGTIEKFVGDAVLAVFGVPRSHGDDPDRAISAALEVTERVAALGDGLAVRVGVEAGEVLARDDGGGDLSVTGDAVNAAARLQQAAGPGEVLVGARAARSCRRASLEEHEQVEAKGIPEPLQTWRALDSVAEYEGPAAPLLGREDDLDLLRLIYRRSIREQVPELAIVTGEAGIGKTRLVSELIGELRTEPERPRILLGRNPPYGRGIAFWALGEILRDAAGAEEEAPVADVQESLAELLEDLGAEDAGSVAAALSIALGGADDGDGASEDDLKRAWRRFVALLAAERPLVLAVDDAHWADDGLLDLLEEATFGVQDAPLLLLCTTRPELAEQRPGFGRTSRNVTQVELRPLRPEATTRLVEVLIPDQARALAPRVAQASGGNPFFAEEVACRIAEDPGAGAPERLPDTVQAAIAARIDLLPADEKRALQVASVLGHNFGDASLDDLLGVIAGDLLAALERKALVQERLAAGPGHYVFRHQLIRDVAYASLPRAERAQLHERAAEGLRTRAGARHTELAELIAFHVSRAAELEPSPERAAVAREATEEAAEIAVRRGAAARGQDLYEQVAELAEDDADRIDPLRNAARIALRRWRGDHSLRLLREVAATAERAGDRRTAATCYAEAVEVAARMAGVTGLTPESELLEMLQRGRDLVPEDDEATRALLVADEAWVAWVSDREEDMVAPAEAALELARSAGDPGVLSSALDAMAAASWFRGRQRAAVTFTRERLELLEGEPRSHALEVERSDARHMAIESLLDVGEFREAYENASEAREFDLARGIVYMAWTRGMLPAFYLGSWDEAAEMGVRFREGWLAADRPPVAACAAAVASIGAIHGYRGDEPAASQWFEFAEGIAPDLGGQRAGLVIWRTELDLHHGRFAAAAERAAHQEKGLWWRGPYEATRAEAYVRADHPDTDKAIAVAEQTVGEHRYAQALLLRAKGLHAGDEGMIGEALAHFEAMECPYQAARTGWLLGGGARTEAERSFERLGCVLPSE